MAAWRIPIMGSGSAWIVVLDVDTMIAPKKASMNILLLGATGQIGNTLAAHLAKTNHSTTLLVRKDPKTFPASLQVLEAANFTGETFDKALKNIDLAIYSIGIPEQWQRDSGIFLRTNRELLEIFLKSVAGSGLKHLVYVSTYEVFSSIRNKISESHPLLERDPSRYFDSMIHSMRIVKDFEKQHSLKMITIHPAAVYGGLNTGFGATDFILNISQQRFWKTPAIFPSRFPLVHVDSLASGILKAIESGKWGESYLFSDGMTSFKTISEMVRGISARSFKPPVIPIWLARILAFFLGLIAGITGKPPIVSKAQIDFVTKGLEPVAAKAQRELGWVPLALEEGLRRMLAETKD